MLSQRELKEELRNISRTLSSIVFAVGNIQEEMVEMVQDVVEEKLKDGGILKWKLRAHEDQLDIVFSHYRELIRLNWERKLDDPI
jgi:fructose 1,6-bisphosphatase